MIRADKDVRATSSKIAWVILFASIVPSAHSASLTTTPLSGSCTGLLKDEENPDALFKNPASSLSPDQLNAISIHAQALDQENSPLGKIATRISNSLLNLTRKESFKTRARLLGNQARGVTEIYEIGIIGLGIHGRIFANTVQTLAPEAKMIGFDAGNGISRTFDSDFFHLNSSNGPELDDTPLLYSPVQVREMMEETNENVYPLARRLADSSHFSLAALNMDILLEDPIKKVERANGLFILTSASGIVTRVRKLVIGIGYGKTNLNYLDADSRKIIEDSTANLLSGKTHSVATTFDDLRVYAEEQKKLGVDIAPSFDQLDVAIVGGNDGGSVVAEWATRSPSHGRRWWIGTTGKSAAEFISTVGNKKRYGDLVGKISRSEITPVLGHLSQIKRVVTPPGKPAFELVYTNLEKTQSITADAVIVVTGYEKGENLLGDLSPAHFANNHDPELPGVWDSARKREADYREKFPDRLQQEMPFLYSIGVNAFLATHAPSVSPGSGITVQIAKQLTEEVTYLRNLKSLTPAEGKSIKKSFRIVEIQNENVLEPRIARAALKSLLLKASRKFRFKTDLNIVIARGSHFFDVTLKNADGTVAEEFLSALTHSSKWLGFALDSVPMGEYLEVAVPISTGGGLRMDKAEIKRVPSR